MNKLVDKTVKMKLVGLDGNVFMLMGTFSREARRQGWTANEIQAVIDQAQAGGNYANFLATLMVYCK